jgi:hypothetical protein
MIPDIPDNSGARVLHHAAQGGTPEHVQALELLLVACLDEGKEGGGIGEEGEEEKGGGGGGVGEGVDVCVHAMAGLRLSSCGTHEQQQEQHHHQQQQEQQRRRRQQKRRFDLEARTRYGGWTAMQVCFCVCVCGCVCGWLCLWVWVWVGGCGCVCV